MNLSERLIEEIKQKNDIIEVISEHVKLQKQGEAYLGVCPFHQDKTKTFSVNRSTQTYYCLGCGTGGNVITFIMEYKNCTFVEAIKFLAERGNLAVFDDINKIAK
jgi:DNA primase